MHIAPYQACSGSARPLHDATDAAISHEQLFLADGTEIDRYVGQDTIGYSGQ